MFLAESICEPEYINPYCHEKKAVLLKTDNDEEVEALLKAIKGG